MLQPLTLQEIFKAKPVKPSVCPFPEEIPKGYDNSPFGISIYMEYSVKVKRYAEYLEKLSEYKKLQSTFYSLVHNYLFHGDLLLAKLETRKQTLVVNKVLKEFFPDNNIYENFCMDLAQFSEFVDHCEDLAQFLLDAS